METPATESKLEKLAKEYKELASSLYSKESRDISDVDINQLKNAFYILSLSDEELVEALKRIAKQYGGCLSCAYSIPHPLYLSLYARSCKLGLSQGNCKKYTPLV